MESILGTSVSGWSHKTVARMKPNGAMLNITIEPSKQALELGDKSSQAGAALEFAVVAVTDWSSTNATPTVSKVAGLTWVWFNPMVLSSLEVGTRELPARTLFTWVCFRGLWFAFFQRFIVRCYENQFPHCAGHILPQDQVKWQLPAKLFEHAWKVEARLERRMADCENNYLQKLLRPHA